MAVVRLELSGKPIDGQQITFKAPCNASEVTAIRGYYVSNEERVSMQFTMKDANNNDIGDINNLFKKDALVQVVLNVTDKVAHFVNADTNGYINHRLKVREVTLSSSGWSSSAPYTQTISVSDISVNDRPEICVGTPSTFSADAYKALNKAFGMIDRAVSGDGTITFYCYSKLPTVDIPIIVKGA